MSELMSARNGGTDFRWHLLTTVSALAILTSVNMHNAMAADDDSNRPMVWIELGGQLERAGGQGDNFPVGFVTANPDSPVLHPVSPFQAQNPTPFSFGGNGSVSLQPQASDWIFSAAIRYGRSSNFKHVDHQTNRTHVTPYAITTVEDFADTKVQRRESHAILDFSAGKDLGLGLFGREGSSVVSLGVRFVQFSSTATLDARARPDFGYKYSTILPGIPLPHFHTYHVTGNASRSFRGIGPSLSWTGSAPFLGNPQDGDVALDWGANASVLFGRQKARVAHQESAHYENVKYRAEGYGHSYPLVYQHSGGHSSARSVIVPNVGGFAGISISRANAKVSFGYRADIFFGAVDGGIDTRKSETVGFYGPFASVSVGLP